MPLRPRGRPRNERIRLSRTLTNWLMIGLAAATGLALLWPRAASSPEERQALAEGRVIITYWDRHSGHEHQARRDLIDEFNRSQNEIYVRAVPIGYNAAMEKLLTSIAGGSPPDVCSLDTPILQQLAPEGCFLPLDDLIAETPALDPDAYFDFAWDMVHFDGHTWAIPTTTDTYCLVWNKQAFRDAGLDPERPPQNIAELQEYAAKLTVRTPDGMIDRMGFLPWLPWDLSIMWGGMFGGNWYDAEAGRVNIANDEGLIAAFRWQQSFTLDPNLPREQQPPYAMEPERVAAFSRGLGEYMSANNPFYQGKVAMITEGEWQATFIPRYAPGLDWGVAPLPQPEGVPPRAYAPACIVDVIPSTARHPEEAKRFLQWFYSPRPDGRPSPDSDYNFMIHNIPPRINEALQDRFMDHPRFRVFVEQLFGRELVSYPVMPVSQFMIDQVQRQRERVVFRRTTPEEALQEIETAVNRELERVRALIARRSE